MKKRTILITGSGGFVGQNLIRAFSDLSHRVVAVDVRPHPIPAKVRFVQADIRDRDKMRELCQDVSSIIHNASVVHTRRTQEEFIWDINMGGTENLLKAAQEREVKRFVYISTASAVYEGRDIENGNEALPYSSISQAPYSDSKIAAEKHVLNANGENGILTCAIRPHVVFGPGDQRFLPAVLRKAYGGKLKYGVGKGDKLSDFTYISNLVDAIVSAEKRLSSVSPVAGNAYFVTNGEPMEFFAFINLLLEKLELPLVKRRIPYALAYFTAAMAEAWDALQGVGIKAENGLSRFTIRYLCTHHYFSIEKAKRDLDYCPRISLREGIRLTAEHIQKHGSIVDL